LVTPLFPSLFSFLFSLARRTLSSNTRARYGTLILRCMRCAKSIEAKDEGELERAIETHDAEHAEFRKFMRERALARRGRGL